MNTPIVEIIICTRNRAQQLRNTLLSLAAQTMPHEQYGILVVDDASTDNTPELCRNMMQVLPNMRYVASPIHIGLSRARNTGLEGTSAPFLLFTDDDCIPFPDWVQEMLSALHNNSIVSGSIESPDKNIWQLTHNISQFHPFLRSMPARITLFIAGANMGFTRQILQLFQGFKSELNPAEDMEFVLRSASMGVKVYFAPRAIVRHEPVRTSFRDIITYAAEHASTTILLRQEYRFLLNCPSMILSPSMLFFCSPIIALLLTIRIFLSDPELRKRFIYTAPFIFLTKIAWCFGAARGLLLSKEL